MKKASAILDTIDVVEEFENFFVVTDNHVPEMDSSANIVAVEKTTGQCCNFVSVISELGKLLATYKGISKFMAATLRDCVYGQAVGDALGVPYEFRSRGSFECTDMIGFGSHHQPAGTWSDDTSMALATCDSIREIGHIDVADMRRRFERWYREGAYTVDGLFDIGGTTARALQRGQGCSGERDNGNGSLMRILPLAFTDATDDEIREVSAITHAHATSCDACVRMVNLARRLVSGARPEDIADLHDLPEDEIRSGGYVLDTERAALWCLETTESYRDCVLKAVNLGDDTDTTAAVAGGLAGIVYGMDTIPVEWLRALRGKEVIESCMF